jgi:hypothetical protein
LLNLDNPQVAAFVDANRRAGVLTRVEIDDSSKAKSRLCDINWGFAA